MLHFWKKKKNKSKKIKLKGKWQSGENANFVTGKRLKSILSSSYKNKTHTSRKVGIGHMTAGMGNSQKKAYG